MAYKMILDNQGSLINVDTISEETSSNGVLVTDLTLTTASGTPSKLNYFTEGTHSTTWSGIWASAQTGDLKYTRLNNQVTLLLPQITATATTASFISIDTALPSSLRTSIQQYKMARNVDGGTIGIGAILLDTDGMIYLFRNAASANFTGSGLSGFYSYSLVFSIA